MSRTLRGSRMSGTQRPKLCRTLSACFSCIARDLRLLVCKCDGVLSYTRVEINVPKSVHSYLQCNLKFRPSHTTLYLVFIFCRFGAVRCGSSPEARQQCGLKIVPLKILRAAIAQSVYRLGYVLDDRGSRVRFPTGAGNFFLYHRGPPSFLYSWYQGLFPWG
jgi:hypothetical protein